MRTFYVDACIYLNLWQKEGDERLGVPYWKIAMNFFSKFDDGSAIIYYSGFLLKELKFVMTEEEFNEKSGLFSSSPNFRKLCLSAEELSLARKIESELGYEISFYDIIHMLLAKRSGSALITRDKKLLEIAYRYGVIAKRPEDLS